MSTNDAIAILDEAKESYRIEIIFDNKDESLGVGISIYDKEYGTVLYGYDRNYATLEYELKLHSLEDRDEWEKMGAAIGRNKRIIDLTMSNKMTLATPWVREIDRNAYECIEALYRGLESNGSISRLSLDSGLFPDDNALPIMNLQNALFKPCLKHLEIKKCETTTNNFSLMISSALENMSLESLDMSEVMRETDERFQRFVLACQ